MKEKGMGASSARTKSLVPLASRPWLDTRYGCILDACRGTPLIYTQNLIEFAFLMP
jgi:hypothetical protein